LASRRWHPPEASPACGAGTRLYPFRLQQPAQRGANTCLVFNDENRAGIAAFLAGRIRNWLGSITCFSAWHLNPEHGALARLGAHIDPVSQHLTDAPDDSQTQSEATALRALGALVVLLTDDRKLILRDTDAAIPNLDPDAVTRALAAQQDPSAVCIAQCVRQQIAQHGLEHVPVGADEQIRPHHAPAQPFFAGEFGEIGRKGV